MVKCKHGIEVKSIRVEGSAGLEFCQKCWITGELDEILAKDSREKMAEAGRKLREEREKEIISKMFSDSA